MNNKIMSKNILITGANGKIAKAIIDILYKNNNLFLFSRNESIASANYKNKHNILSISYKNIETFNHKIDIILHCAFERSQDKEKLDASVRLSKQIANLAKKIDCERFINISSQAVYNMINSKSWCETDIPSPTDLYGAAKLEFENYIQYHLDCNKYINIRLSALTGPNYQQHILHKFIANAYTNNNIKLVGGSQKFLFLNFHDAINALMLLFDLETKPKYNLYNIGNNEQYGIIEMAEEVKKMLFKYNIPVKITVENKPIILNVNMNSSRFMDEFKWKPRYNLSDSIKQIINENYNHEAGKN